MQVGDDIRQGEEGNILKGRMIGADMVKGRHSEGRRLKFGAHGATPFVELQKRAEWYCVVMEQARESRVTN